MTLHLFHKWEETYPGGPRHRMVFDDERLLGRISQGQANGIVYWPERLTQDGWIGLQGGWHRTPMEALVDLVEPNTDLGPLQWSEAWI